MRIVPGIWTGDSSQEKSFLGYAKQEKKRKDTTNESWTFKPLSGGIAGYGDNNRMHKRAEPRNNLASGI